MTEHEAKTSRNRGDCSGPISGADEIARERHRQVSFEGYTPDNDDAYTANELLRAAQAYISVTMQPKREGVASVIWPWDWRLFKPYDPIRNLARAGALIAAEIDRLKRLDTEANHD